ncbi:uncharacterized protein [Spinacia oleracea]|uniref:PGG domain-containing protein n=1 Tax=Spinacia oleracea TaxID=3562 RepID=A0ABM3QZU1_SPIOL|nr:uncharacterized protein LOC110780403 [Spinacia oleracea]
MGNKITAVSDDQMNGFKYENGGDLSDCYIVDLENFSNGVDKQHSANSSRITLQRSLSRKVPQRGTERKLNDRDTLAPSSSPRASQLVSTPEKSPSSPTTTLPILGSSSQDHTMNHHHHQQQQQQQPQHQITIKTGSITTTPEGSRWGRKSSFKRSSYTWYADPKRILLFFATLSSMGTMLLIYFTLSISKPDTEGISDWQ